MAIQYNTMGPLNSQTDEQPINPACRASIGVKKVIPVTVTSHCHTMATLISRAGVHTIILVILTMIEGQQAITAIATALAIRSWIDGPRDQANARRPG